MSGKDKRSLPDTGGGSHLEESAKGTTSSRGRVLPIVVATSSGRKVVPNVGRSSDVEETDRRIDEAACSDDHQTSSCRADDSTDSNLKGKKKGSYVSETAQIFSSEEATETQHQLKQKTHLCEKGGKKKELPGQGKNEPKVCVPNIAEKGSKENLKIHGNKNVEGFSTSASAGESMKGESLSKSYVFLTSDGKDEIELKVKMEKQDCFSVSVGLNDTVEAVMLKIKEIKGFSCENQRLVKAGKMLLKTDTLLSHGIGKDSTIHLLVKKENAADKAKGDSSSGLESNPTEVPETSDNLESKEKRDAMGNNLIEETDPNCSSRQDSTENNNGGSQIENLEPRIRKAPSPTPTSDVGSKYLPEQEGSRMLTHPTDSQMKEKVEKSQQFMKSYKESTTKVEKLTTKVSDDGSDMNQEKGDTEIEFEGEMKIPQTPETEGEKKTPQTPETEGEKKTHQTPETEGEKDTKDDLNVFKMDKGTCLTKDQEDSFKFDGRLIQLTEIQIEALGKSLDEKAIGEGAFGQVYSSKDSELFGIPVAVKKIQTNISAQSEKHARMEMMANRLMNPFILPLIAFAKKSNDICRETWYITPYCENGDLKKAIEDSKARKDKNINRPEIRVRITLQIALAIQYIHTEVPNVRGSILHKDIASSNIVLDKNLNARLIDFGLAREKNDTSNTHSERSGYIHPREGHGDPVKESLDYYNFGIIILELLTSLGPLGEKQLHLKNMNENQIQDKLDKNVWVDKEITKKLYALSKKCLEEFKWTIEEFETNVIKALQDIMRTEEIDIYECQEETCHHCIINPIAKHSSLIDDHYANCTQKIKVCIACEKNSILNPVICYCGKRLKSMIGSKWGALLVAGDDKSPEKAAVMKREILELERVVTSKAPRIIGISKCNVKTVVPCDTKTETKKAETPTWTKIQKHIADFAKNEDIDTLLIYISCHGYDGKVKESSERNMFRLGKSSEYISLVAFEEQLETLNKIDKLIIFLDRCFPPMVEFKDRNREFVQINACSEDETAILKDEGSLFTTYVIQGLKARSEKRECSKDCEHCCSYWNKRTEYISIDSLFDYVNKHLKQKAPTPKRHIKCTWNDIAFFTEEVVHIEFTSKDSKTTIRLQLEYLKNIDEVKRMLLKEFEVDRETHMVKIEKDIFRNDQEADDECKTLEQVMEAWVNRFPLLVSFLKKKET